MKKISLKQYFKFYPILELPVLLTEDVAIEFSRKNKPLSLEAVEEFIIPIETEIDEFTEFVPCFRLPETELFTGIVYWKASLLKKEYLMVTYDLKGNFICRRSLASSFLEEENIKKSVARIDENMTISIVAGHNDSSAKEYDPKQSKVFKIDISDDGQLIFATEEN